MRYLNIILTGLIIFGPLGGLNIVAQVSLVKDISPGGTGSFNIESNPGIAYGEKYIFPAWSEGFGVELWISDGTSSGTSLLKDINEGTGDSNPHLYFNAFGKIYFNAYSEIFGRELWVTDGTTEGTYQVMDIEPGAAGSNPEPGDIYKGYLYFAATSNADREVWRLDSLSTPQLFKDLNPTAQSRPREFKAANGMLYFSANFNPNNDPLIDQDEPFVSDGTPEGTVHLELFVFDDDGSESRDYTPLGDYVFFLASLTGDTLNPDNTLMITEGDQFSTGEAFFSSVYWLMPVKDKMLFIDPTDLWLVEVSPSGWSAHAEGAYKNPLRDNEKKPSAYLNENLCLPVIDEDENIGVELYFSDGSDTWMSADINPGTASSDPWYIVSNGTKALFAASSSDTNRELYESDGTSDGTKLVADLYPGEEGSDPIQLVVAGNNVFFYAKTPETGYELYKYELEPSSLAHPSTIAFDGKAYPQPAISGESVQILWNDRNHFDRAELTQANGSVLQQYEIIDGNQMTIETNHLSPGVYYLNLLGIDGNSVCKIIVQ